MVLGRLATEIAQILKGKRKPQYTPHVDTGDFVIVINAEKIRLTGNKAETKIYYSHSGYVGGLKEVSFKRMLEKHPERIIEKAVKGMLPKNTLGRAMNRKLKVYAGPNHPHAAQKPREITLEA
jgi:large subunit ribosomal protein L13